jgi:alkanesulfonate monooxygenase SsuD/methylene tetrahydromethanopterin reductase-like flavin-dependent oxidoreductase (luciferase family)
MVGRGSFIESFPLFGYDLNDYDELFIEKLELLLKIREQERVTWSGKLRAPLDDQGVYPRPLQEVLPIWVGVGGNPGSAIRTGMLGLPMALAIIGGLVPNMLPLVEYYREGARHAGRDPLAMPLSINSHGYIADTTQQAIDESYPYYETAMKKYARERGWSQPNRVRYEAELSLKGAQVAGSPEQVIEKILYQHELFGHRRFLLQLSISTMPHDKIMRAIELYGTKVAPVVRAEVAKRNADAALPAAGS